MSGDYKPSVGDRVRVVLEGEVTQESNGLISVTEGKGSFTLDPRVEPVLSVEKVEPPVVTFQPGQTVRHRAAGSLYSIGDDGYFSHGRHRYIVTSVRTFTSADYDPVSL